MILLVTGSRNIDDPSVFRSALAQTGWPVPQITEVWHGNAEGVDQLASEWADAIPSVVRAHAVPAEAFDSPTERNEALVRMAEKRTAGGDVRVLAIPGPESRGTWDTVRHARESGLEVHVYEVAKERDQVSLDV